VGKREDAILLSLGKEVRARRKEKKLSQETLALQAGVHTNVVGRLERGEYNPSVTLLFAIAVKLSASLPDLFTGAAKR
jgi:transcriptional regulator with XRE-family HTH domain